MDQIDDRNDSESFGGPKVDVVILGESYVIFIHNLTLDQLKAFPFLVPCVKKF